MSNLTIERAEPIARHREPNGKPATRDPGLSQRQFFWVVSYMLALAVFALRPSIPRLRDALWGSPLGAWSMYRARVESEDGAVLVAPGAQPVAVNIARYFWHARFASTAHGEPRQAVLDEFAHFLVAREELCAAVRNQASTNWTLVVFVAYRSGPGPIRTIESRLPACGRK